MWKQSFIEFYSRDLNKLKEELSAYHDESEIWLIKEGINNSAGNLALHLIGNLRHFIGSEIGKNGYIRNRDEEFTLKNIPLNQLLADIDLTIVEVTESITKLNSDDFEKNYPLEKAGRIVTYEHMLLHLLIHLGYHLGQINYHRRLINS